MLITKLGLRNFGSYQELELDFSALGRTVSVFGSTGAGKTTLLIDALTLGLFGRSYGVLSEKSARWTIPPNANWTEVWLEFKLGSDIYKLWRKLERGGEHQARLYQLTPVARIIADKPRDVEHALNQLLGWDYLSLLNTVVVRQADVESLISSDPQERRKILLKAFGIDFSLQYEAARQRRDSISGQLAEIQYKIQQLEQQLNRIPGLRSDLDKLRSQLPELERAKSRLESQLDQIEQELRILETNRAQLQARAELPARERERILVQITNLSSELERMNSEIRKLERAPDVIKQLKSKLDEIEPKLVDIGKLESELESLNRTRDGLLEQKARLQGKMEQLELYLSQLGQDQPRCPVCGSQLSPGSRQARIQHLMHERSEVESEIQKISRDLELKESQLNQTLSELDRLRKLQLEFLDLKHQLSMALRDRDLLVELMPRRNSLENQILELSSELRELEIPFQQLRNELSQLESQLRSKLEIRSRIMADLGRHRELLGGIKQRIQDLESEIQQLDELRSQLDSLRIQRSELENLMEAYAKLMEILGDRGMPLALLSSSLVKIQEYAARYLEQLLPGKRIKLDLDQRAERIQIQILDDFGERPLETYSGGERKLIGFALRLGISKALSELALKVQPRFLIIDEGFGALSQEFRQGVLNLLGELSMDYDQILVISHLEDIQQSGIFQSSLRIFKDSQGFSRLELM